MYNPQIGEKVKLKLFEMYTHRNLSPWSWFKVLECKSGFLKLHLLNGDKETDKILEGVKLEDISPPLGYADVYEIALRDSEQVKKLQGWLTERGGINVFVSHDLSTPGRYNYTPADVKDRPHWSMFLVETVTDKLRFKFLIEETSDTKPKPKSQGWKYDRRAREWFRRVPVNG